MAFLSPGEVESEASSDQSQSKNAQFGRFQHSTLDSSPWIVRNLKKTKAQSLKGTNARFAPGKAQRLLPLANFRGLHVFSVRQIEPCLDACLAAKSVEVRNAQDGAGRSLARQSGSRPELE
jgi:hypothetical protein